MLTKKEELGLLVAQIFHGMGVSPDSTEMLDSLIRTKAKHRYAWIVTDEEVAEVRDEVRQNLSGRR